MRCILLVGARCSVYGEDPEKDRPVRERCRLMGSTMGAAAFDEAKFRELVVYIASQCEQMPRYGTTKLYKILFYSDFESYRRTGKPITSATYLAYEHGPIPAERNIIRDDMVIAHELALQMRGQQRRYIPLRDADLNKYFTAEEISIVDEFIEQLRNDTADMASERSHLDSLGWLAAYTEYKATGHDVAIPYETVFVSNRRMDEFEEISAWEMLNKYDLCR